MTHLNKLPALSELKILKFWERRFSKKRSKFKRFMVSLFIATLGFVMAFYLFHRTGSYFPSIIILTSTIITLSSGLFSGLSLIVILAIAADYFLIPPVGSVFITHESIEYFIVVLLVGATLNLLLYSIRFSFKHTLIAKQEAEKAVQARDVLIAVISHELKNPLTAISSSIQLLSRTTPHLEKQLPLTKAIRDIKISVHRMNKLVCDLLDINQFESHRITLQYSYQNLITLLDHVMDTFAHPAKAKALQLGYQLSENCPAEIYCDPDRIIQALSNIIENAIKFTDRGSITVHVESMDSGVLFQIQDTGPGIRKDQIPRLFNRFWQAKDTAYRGTGLGLSISKEIVEAHQGKIWAESKAGEGSSFYFILPGSYPSPSYYLKNNI